MEEENHDDDEYELNIDDFKEQMMMMMNMMMMILVTLTRQRNQAGGTKTELQLQNVNWFNFSCSWYWKCFRFFATNVWNFNCFYAGIRIFLDFFSPMFEISIVVYGLYWKCYNYVEIYQLWLINFFIISKLLK